MRSVLAVSLAVAAVSGLVAQQPPPTFRTAKTLALVDVAVTDKAGGVVADLDPSDFELTSGGRRVSVEAFYRVVDNKVTPFSGSTLASGVTVPYTPLRTFILFFDGNIGLAALGRAKAAAQAFLQREIGGGDYAGVIWGGTFVHGRLFTSREAAMAAVGSVRPDPDALARMITPPRNVADAESTGRTKADEAEAEIAAALTAADQGVGDGGAGWERNRTLSALLAVVKGMHTLPGRKVIVLLSNGFPISGTMPGDRGNTGTETGAVTMRMIVKEADTAGVRIYTIDPRGLDQGFASSKIIAAEAPRPLGTPTNPDEMGIPGKQSPRIAPEDVLSSLALDSGGLWLHNENNLERAFERLSRDAGSYYVLGYDASGAAKAGSVKVHVKRSGVTVRARTGVTAR